MGRSLEGWGESKGDWSGGGVLICLSESVPHAGRGAGKALPCGIQAQPTEPAPGGSQGWDGAGEGQREGCAEAAGWLPLPASESAQAKPPAHLHELRGDCLRPLLRHTHVLVAVDQGLDRAGGGAAVVKHLGGGSEGERGRSRWAARLSHTSHSWAEGGGRRGPRSRAWETNAKDPQGRWPCGRGGSLAGVRRGPPFQLVPPCRKQAKAPPLSGPLLRATP